MNRFFLFVRTQTIGPSNNVISWGKNLLALNGRTKKVRKPLKTLRELAKARVLLNQELQLQGTRRWMNSVPQIPPIHSMAGYCLRLLKQYVRGPRKEG